jgi:5-methylcytosine-specific restriction endonuclease McrA
VKDIEYLQVKDFDRFQHYKDRDPPWIKLYVRILQDYAFGTLPDTQKAHLMLIWVLASKMDNKIPKDAAFVTRCICASTTVDLDALVVAGFLQPWCENTSRGKRENWPSRYVAAQIRTDLLSAAQHRCASCPATEHLEIDHIVPISKGGTGDPDNLQVLCRKCNRKKRALLRAESAERLRSEPLRRNTDLRSPETETEKKKSSQTWLTPFADHWQRRCGNPPFGKLASVLAPLHKEHGAPETLARWSRYLDATDPKFASVHRFAETFNSWGEPDTKEMTDEFGRMVLHRRDAAGQWVASA